MNYSLFYQLMVDITFQEEERELARLLIRLNDTFQAEIGIPSSWGGFDMKVGEPERVVLQASERSSYRRMLIRFSPFKMQVSENIRHESTGRNIEVDINRFPDIPSAIAHIHEYIKRFHGGPA